MSRLEALKELAEKVEAGSDMSWHDFWPISNDEPAIKARQAYDGSLDAALALHEAVLPGWECVLNTYRCWARLWDQEDEDSHSVEAIADTPARAWLLAILRALIAEATP